MSDKPPSKFASVLRARTTPDEIPPQQEERPLAKTGNNPEDRPAAPQQGLQEVASRSVGRPRTGKRSNEEYIMTTIYVRAETRDEAESVLRKQRRRTKQRRDFSDLVEELVTNWLEQQNEQRNA